MDVISKLIAKILGFYNEEYAMFVLLMPKRKLYYLLLRLNLLRILKFYRIQKQLLKHPLDKETIETVTDEIDHFLAYGN